ncbi:MAG: sulfatase-like hydrolase/transferase, partial [Myxococcota bacterium]|nr:sulfatase-like hydrolase/transferase [Myxococcota bacterium]
QAPYFLFVHYYDAHGPFRAGLGRLGSFRRNVPPRPVDIPVYQRMPNRRGGYHDDLEYYSDLYDASIREQDEALGRLLRGIDPDHSIVILIADHGESLAERLRKGDHGTYVFGEQTHIPLLMRIPGFAPRRFGGLVETTDLVPSLLELLGLDVPGGAAEIDGRSFVAALDSPTKSGRAHAVSIAAARASAFADRDYELDPRFPIASIIAQAAPHWKLIRYPGARGPVHELYRLETDPSERVDLAKTSPAAFRELSDQLDAELPRLDEQLRTVLDEELQQQLEALGYIQ